MKQPLSSVTVVAIWTLVAALSACSSVNSDEKEIRGLIANYRAAANARDLHAVMSCYATTDSVLVYDVLHAPYRGTEAITRDWDQFMTAMDVIDLEFRDIEIMVGADHKFAYAHFIERASFTPKQGTPQVNDNLRTTHIYEKIDGRWLIVHEHKSKSLSN